MFLYLALSDAAVSAVLVQDDEGVQNLVYYVSKYLIDAQTRYTRIDKLIFALFVTTRKLKHYFQFFLIVVLIEYPLKIIVENPEATRRIARRVTEIRPLGVTFKPRTTIKGQVLADFIAKFTSGSPPQSNLLKGWNTERGWHIKW